MLAVVGLAAGQLVDDFSCPDEYQGFYPHLIRYKPEPALHCYEQLIVSVSRGAAPVSQNCRTAVSITKLEKRVGFQCQTLPGWLGAPCCLSARLPPATASTTRATLSACLSCCLAACLSDCLVSHLAT